LLFSSIAILGFKSFSYFFKLSLNLFSTPSFLASINNLSSASILSNNEQKSSQENSSKEKDGIFTKMFNYIKNNWNPWKIEEEEVIDAHGFKCKRPKTKIPLRKKGDSYEEEIKKTGGESLSYATQYSGFGKLFL
jgi:hypothetical protein